MKHPQNVHSDTDTALIEELGGPAQVARLLGWTKAGSTQRVTNWKARGIPARIKLDYPHLFARHLVRHRRPPKAAAE